MTISRKALIVGVNNYSNISPLYGCVNDAKNVAEVLARHANKKANFDCRTLTADHDEPPLKRSTLRTSIQELFATKDEIALFYFSGHGHLESTGGYLCSSDTESGDDGISLSDLVLWANQSEAQNKILILDSCHSGIAGSNLRTTDLAEISDGVTILTASTEEQYASEENGSGVFTSLLVDALNGAAANLVGEITPSGVYAHIDQSLGTWGQRPVFKTNVKRFVSLRTVEASIPFENLLRINELFPEEGYDFQLSPEYEPERQKEYKSSEAPSLPPPDPHKNEIFSVLQSFNRVGLLVPVGAPHMWHAAIESKSAKLTPLGEHYRRLAQKGRF